MSAYRNTTLARVKIFTWESGAFQIPIDNAINASSLVGFETSKTIGLPSGSWSVSLKPDVTQGRMRGKAWTDLIEQGDWVAIDVIKNGVPIGVITGVVDAIGCGISAGAEGAGDVNVTIRGRDCGAILEDTPIYFNPWDERHNNSVVTMMKVTEGEFGQDPAKLIVNLIRGFLGSDAMYGGMIRLPPGVTTVGPLWIDLVDTSVFVQKQLRGGIFEPAQMLNTDNSSSLWAYFNQWRNPLMNEMFVDTNHATSSDRRAYLVFRERPFVNRSDAKHSTWFRLATHEIAPDTIVDLSLTKGLNRTNHVIVMNGDRSWLASAAYLKFRPAYDEKSINRYGLRRVEETTEYFSVDPTQSNTAPADWTDLVLSWNALNHRMWQGTISLGEMRPEIRVGHRVKIPTPPANYHGLPHDLTLYVESVSHSYTEGETPGASTTIQVSRGYNDDKIVEDLLAAMAKFSTDYSFADSSSPNKGETAPDSAPAIGGASGASYEGS
ncbi:MAG: hypothetical protein A2Y38_21700 [Spirochaetes bacterium GWB1_59_5]|nr:MAG: hypothetical protein A2Y38_21700 [Spirochaetes bacterium GWB1_59_5]